MNDASDNQPLSHPLWLGTSPLVLASASRTRHALLIGAGIPVEVIPASIDERAIAAPLVARGVAANRIAVDLAVAKAHSVAARAPGRYILGADQTLSCEGAMLHKPVDRRSAHEQLMFLSDRMHQLHAGVAIVQGGVVLCRFAVSARLTMRNLSERMITQYLDAAGDSILESVGGYQLERTGIHLFRRIAGDHSTILGLPMIPTLQRLRKLALVVA